MKRTRDIILLIIFMPIIILGFIFKLICISFKVGMDICKDFINWIFE